MRRLRDAANEARAAEATDESEHATITVETTLKLLGEAESVVREVEANYADESALLRLLATLGLAAAEFNHETGMTFQAIRLDLERVFETALEAGGDEAGFAEVVGRAQGAVSRLDALTSYLNEIASARAVRELAPVSVTLAVEEFENGMKDLAFRSMVVLCRRTPEFDGLYTVPIHRADIASILLNFYSNSIKAVKRVDGERRVLVEAQRDGDEIVIQFSDTGDGIPDSRRDRIFDLFYTTRTAAAPGSSVMEETTGTGLGLWIVRQIVSRANGTAKVVDAANGYTTTLEVRLPAKREES